MNDLYLLDTHVVLWAVSQPHRLHPDILSIVENNRYAVSVASLWELVNRKAKSGAPVKNPSAWWDQYVVQPKTPVIPIRVSHVLQLEQLPMLHKDPFDRMLIAQSFVERLPLVTDDALIHKYEMGHRSASAASR